MGRSITTQSISLQPHIVGRKEYKYLLQQLAEIIYKELSQQQSKVIANSKPLNVAPTYKEGRDVKKEAK